MDMQMVDLLPAFNPRVGDDAKATVWIRVTPCSRASHGASAIMRPSSPACSGVTWAIEGICALGTMRKCTGAQGWMS